LTAEELGNDHGYQCPNCKRGDNIEIAATHWVGLVPDGTSTDDVSDWSEEWDGTNAAMCRACEWAGNVGQLLAIELEEEA
jgi:hypothetical protein